MCPSHTGRWTRRQDFLVQPVKVVPIFYLGAEDFGCCCTHSRNFSTVNFCGGCGLSPSNWRATVMLPAWTSKPNLHPAVGEIGKHSHEPVRCGIALNRGPAYTQLLSSSAWRESEKIRKKISNSTRLTRRKQTRPRQAVVHENSG
jgi:hypothetical protein